MISRFFEKYPALGWGLTLFLGTAFTLQSPLAFLPFSFFLLDKKRVLIFSLLFLLPTIYVYHFYTFPSSNSFVEGKFVIKSVSAAKGFSKGWNYRGVLKTKNGRIYCYHYSKQWIKPNCSYFLKAVAFSRSNHFYSLKVLDIQPSNSSFSFAAIRYELKSRVKNYIHRSIEDTKAANFLTAMVTGELEDHILWQEFKNLGLSHIMAISGFHFAILTLAFHLILRFFLSYKVEAIVLIFALLAYLFFIGDSPSIQRAWIFATLFFMGQLLERPSSPLNSLGVALICAILLNPLSASTLGFQLSFLATAGILLYYPLINRLLQLWIPKISFKEAIDHSLFWQHGYLVVSVLRNAFALTLSVHFVLFPLLIKYFHTISFNSLIYNLFFPFCASVALFLFLLSVLTGGMLHVLNNWYLKHLLTLTQSPPLFFKTLYIENIPDLFLTIYLTSLFIIAIYYHEQNNVNKPQFVFFKQRKKLRAN